MNNLDKQYFDLLADILENGTKKKDRTGVGTYSVFGRQMRFKMSEGFPLVTTKKIYTKAIFYELLWFLRGGDNIKYLVDNGVRIWNDWPHKKYCEYVTKYNEDGAKSAKKLRAQGKRVKPAYKDKPTLEEFVDMIRTDDAFAAEWGNLGPVYGKQWVDWGGGPTTLDGTYYDKEQGPGLNQIDQIIDDLKNNPDSRRIMLSAWNPAELPNQLLPPCFLENTIVRAYNGYCNIKDIKIGDLVVTHDGTYHPVNDLMVTPYRGKVLEIKFISVPPIICTKPHEFLTLRGWVEAKDLKFTDYVCLFPINEEVIPTINGMELSELEQWWMMGYFVGDGFVSSYVYKKDGNPKICFSINDDDHDTPNRIKKVLKISKINKTRGNVHTWETRKKDWSSVLKEFGHGAFNKKIPAWVLSAPKNLIEAFLDGYNRADGCDVKRGKIMARVYSTVSPDLAFGIHALSMKVGVPIGVSKQKRPNKTIIEGRTVNQRDSYLMSTNKSNGIVFIDDKVWVKMDSVNERDFDGKVYNLSVEKNHTYSVNNLVTHNCHYAFQLWTKELDSKERRDWYKKNHGAVKLVDLMKYSYEDVQEDKEKNKHIHDLMDEMNVPKRSVSLMFHMRSTDLFLGGPFDIASYATLLHMIAHCTDMVADELIITIGDAHIYLNHIDQVKELVSREPYELPTFQFDKYVSKNIYKIEYDHLVDALKNYKCHPSIKAEVAV